MPHLWFSRAQEARVSREGDSTSSSKTMVRKQCMHGHVYLIFDDHVINTSTVKLVRIKRNKRNFDYNNYISYSSARKYHGYNQRLVRISTSNCTTSTVVCARERMQCACALSGTRTWQRVDAISRCHCNSIVWTVSYRVVDHQISNYFRIH